jgi:hypothetical protein
LLEGLEHENFSERCQREAIGRLREVLAAEKQPEVPSFE